MSSLVGIKSAHLIPRGQGGAYVGGSAVDGAFAVGIRKSAGVTVKGFDDGKDVKNRNIPNKSDVMFETDILHADMSTLFYLRGFAIGNGCELVLFTEGTNLSNGKYYSPGGVFFFTGTNYLGIDFDFKATLKERSVKVTLQKALKRNVYKALVQAAATNGVTLHAGHALVNDHWDWAHPFSFKGLYKDNVLLFSPDEILELSIGIKTKSTKFGDNHSRVTTLQHTLEFTFADASPGKIAELISNNVNSTFKIVSEIIDQNGNYVKDEEFIFNAGTLSMKPEFTISEEKSDTKLIFEGDCSIANPSIQTGGASHQYIVSL